MSKQDMRPTPPEEHYTVDEILEEFGSGAPAEEPSPIPDPARSPYRTRPRILSRSRKANRKPDRSPFPSRNTARTTRPLPPGRIPWISCAAGYRPGRRTPTSPAWSRRRTTRTPFCRSGRL